jgi:hypothetical protein
MDAGQDFHERRLASPVLSHQGVHLTCPEIEIHTSDRVDPGEVFVDAAHLEQQAVCHPSLLGCPVGQVDAASAPGVTSLRLSQLHGNSMERIRVDEGHQTDRTPPGVSVNQLDPSGL